MMNLKERLYEERTAGFLQTFLEKEGFCLLRTEFVREEGLAYLRVYLDLTEEERNRRRQEAESPKNEAEAGKNEAEFENNEAEAGKNEAEAGENEAGGRESCHGQEADALPPEPGVGINDCAQVSRRLSRWLDQKDFIDEEYTLEVCSKGYLKPEQTGCPEDGRLDDNREA